MLAENSFLTNTGKIPMIKVMFKKICLLFILLLSIIFIVGCSSEQENVFIHNNVNNITPILGPNQRAFTKNDVVYYYSQTAGSVVAMSRYALDQEFGFFVWTKNMSKEWIDFKPQDITVTLENASGDKKVYPISNGDEYLSKLKGKYQGATTGLFKVFIDAAKTYSNGLVNFSSSGETNLSSLETAMLKSNTIFPDQEISGWVVVKYTGEPSFVPYFLKISLPLGKDTHTFVFKLAYSR